MVGSLLVKARNHQESKISFESTLEKEEKISLESTLEKEEKISLESTLKKRKKYLLPTYPTFPLYPIKIFWTRPNSEHLQTTN